MEPISESTKGILKELSRGMLRLHKSLLDQSKVEYESQHGRIQSVSQYFQLVVDDPHFAWLRKLSSLVALIDEAVSVRRPATEAEAKALLLEAEFVLNFRDEEVAFNDKFQSALTVNPEAVVIYNELIRILENRL